MRSFLLSLFSHHTLYLIRIDLHFLWIRLRNLLNPRKPAQIKPKSRYLNLACGSNGPKSPLWFNLDGWPIEGVDYATDLKRKLPFPNERFDGIFCEHFFEHLSPHDRALFLTECHRILVTDGSIRISVPDGALYLEKYFNDRAWLAQRRGGNKRPMDVVNEVFRQRYEHEYCYDADTLIQCLIEAGFIDVKRAYFGAGRDPALLIDQEQRSFESLYIEGSKARI